MTVMAENKEWFHNVEVCHMVSLGKDEYCQEGMEGHFHHNALFVGANTKKAVNDGRGDYTPCFFYEIPRLFESELPVDVALIMVTPPDENGKVSLGVSVDYTKVRQKMRRSSLHKSMTKCLILMVTVSWMSLKLIIL